PGGGARGRLGQRGQPRARADPMSLRRAFRRDAGRLCLRPRHQAGAARTGRNKMNQEYRDRFAALHQPGNPILLYNIWDVSSAKAVAEAGAQAIATGSHGLAEANGFPDGEGIPLALLLDCVRRIVGAVELPVTVRSEERRVGEEWNGGW